MRRFPKPQVVGPIPAGGRMVRASSGEFESGFHLWIGKTFIVTSDAAG